MDDGAFSCPLMCIDEGTAYRIAVDRPFVVGFVQTKAMPAPDSLPNLDAVLAKVARLRFSSFLGISSAVSSKT